MGHHPIIPSHIILSVSNDIQRPISKMSGLFCYSNYTVIMLGLKVNGQTVTGKILFHFWPPYSLRVHSLRKEFAFLSFNPIALRKAKIVYNFGLSECNRVK